MADGSIIAPFTDLKTALENPKLQDGDTIYLRHGVHLITEATTISASGITIRPYPGEVASIRFHTREGQKRLTIDGNNVRFRHLELWSDPPHRMMRYRFDRAEIHQFNVLVNGNAPDDGLFADCRIHDMYDVQWYGQSQGGCIYRDCDLFNMGIDSADGIADGEHLYTQNLDTSPLKYVDNSVFGPCYSVSFQCYSEKGYVCNYRFRDLIFCHSGQIYNATYANPIVNLRYERLMRLNTPVLDWAGVEWDEIALSANSPTIIVNPCTTTGAKRVAHIGINNPTSEAAVSVDVSALSLTTGASYRLRNALDPLADYEDFAYDGSGAISINMTARSVAVPIGAAAPLVAWDVRFGAYVLETA